MKLKENKKVLFAELPGTNLHQYLLTKTKNSEPVNLSGVTSMMRKLGISKDMSAIKPDVLARAASRGTAIHEMFQAWEMGQAVVNPITYEWVTESGKRASETEDLRSMLKNYTELSQANFKAVAVEYLVSDNESVASMIDFVSEVDENTVDLVDYKSSSVLDKKALQWQLSFYKRLFEQANKNIKVRNLVGVHCHSDKVKLVSVAYLGDETVDEALASFKAGETLSGEATTLPATLSLSELVPDYPELSDLLALKRDLQAKIDEIDEQTEDALAELKEKMSMEHISETAVPGGRYVLVAEHETSRLDSKGLRSKYPDIAEEFTKTTMTAASLKFYKDR